jgi:membrane-associated phospholipid phosphatase
MTLGAIVEQVGRADTAMFRFINHTLYWRPAADLTFYLANDHFLIGLLLAAALGLWLLQGWRRALTLTVWSALAVLASNLLHNLMFKPFFNRTRPFLVLADVHLSAPLKDLSSVSLSFPSTHASSAAALAMVVSHLDPGLRVWSWLFAFGVGWGAVYSGGHFPVDVLVGYAVGSGLGYMLNKFSDWTWPGPVKK